MSHNQYIQKTNQDSLKKRGKKKGDDYFSNDVYFYGG